MPSLRLLATALLALAAPAAAQLDFSGATRSYLEERGYPTTDPRGLDLPEILREHYAGARLGAIDLRFPRAALDDTAYFDKVRTLALEILSAQETWASWLAHGDFAATWEQAELDKDIKRLTRWVKSWRKGALKSAFDDGERDFTPDPEKSADAFASQRAVAEFLGRAQPLALEGLGSEATTIYLLPERKEFVELACVFGWVYSNLRHEYWSEETWSWTQFYYEDSHFLALEFAAPIKGGGGYSGDYSRGTPMKKFNAEGLEQQVVQLSMRGVFKKHFGGRLTPALDSGLASLLVIELYGEVDTRTDGDLRAKETAARSMFVPGGASGGGTLPPNYADGRFRSPSHGADYFIPALRKAQKAGAKEFRNKDEKHARFEILSDNESGTYILEAPLLDPSAARLTPPSHEFRGDLLELMRAYRICFMHWLRNETSGSEEESQRRFVEFLQALGSGRTTLVEAVKTAYEVPLSDAEVSEDCLEGRFLRWLQVQR